MKLRPSIRRQRAAGRRHRGQTLVFLMMLMTVLAFMMFSVYDTQHVAVQRVHSQNSVDAAALAGAKWQLTSLNAIGELNLLKVTTAIVTQVPPGLPAGASWKDIYAAFDQMQARIMVTGPLLGVLYAQQAAKLNGMHVVVDFAKSFYDLATLVGQFNDPQMMGYHYQNDYVTLLRLIADQGVAALPASAAGVGIAWEPPLTGWQRWLADRRFYSAVAAKDWCYLKPLLLAPYTDWTFWGAMTPSVAQDPFRFLRLGVAWDSNSNVWNGLTGAQQISMQQEVGREVQQRGLDLSPNWPSFTTTNWPQFQLPQFSDSYVPLNWAVYDNSWGTVSSYVQSQTGLNVTDYLVSDVKDEFDYTGADSVWMVQASANVTMAVANPNQTSWTSRQYQSQENLQTALNDLASIKQQAGSTGHGIVASAAAKPFGQISSESPPGKPNEYGVVLPNFDSVRLIPILLSSAGGDFDPVWLEHLYQHVPPYTVSGLGVLQPGCYYCQQLVAWESPVSQQGEAFWAANSSYKCPPGGSGGRGGIIVH